MAKRKPTQGLTDERRREIQKRVGRIKVVPQVSQADQERERKNILAKSSQAAKKTNEKAESLSRDAMRSYNKDYGKTDAQRRVAHAANKARQDRARRNAAEAGRQGRTLDKLKYETQSEINQKVTADRDSADLGQPRKEEKGTFTKVLDVILRTSRATNQAIIDNQDAYYLAKYKKKNTFQALGAGLAAGFDGYLGDIKEGDTKASGKQVFQEVRGNRQALRKGVDPRTIGRVKAKTKKGRILDSVGGFVLEVGADPLTYAGVGTVRRAVDGAGKVLKSADVAKRLEETVEVSRAVVNSKGGSLATNTELARSVAADNIPVRLIRKKDLKTLSPEAQALHKFVMNEQKATKGKVKMGASNSRNFDKKGIAKAAQEAVEAVKTAEYLKFAAEQAAKGKGVTGRTPVVALQPLKDPALRSAVQKTLDDEIAKFPFLLDTIPSVRVTGSSGAGGKIADDYARSFFDGDIKVKHWWGDRDKVLKAMADEPDKWASVVSRTPEEYVSHVMIHEIGHQIAFSMSKEAEREVWKLIKPWAESSDDLAKNLSKYPTSKGDLREVFDETLAEAWLEFRVKGAAARPLAKTVGEYMENYVKNYVPGKQVLSADAKAAQKAIEAFATSAKAHVDDVLKTQGIDAKTMTEELAAQALRNLNLSTKTNLSLRFGKAEMVLPALGVAKAARAVGSIPHVARTIEVFNNNLRANYGIIPGLSRLRNQAAGVGTSQIKAEVIELNSVFTTLKKADRRAMMSAIRQGVTTGSYRGGRSLVEDAPVDDAIAYTLKTFEDLERSLTPQLSGGPMNIGDGFTMTEINAFLSDKYKLTDSAKLKEKGWLLKAIKANDKIDDPAEALLMYKGALAHAVAKRTMWKSFADEFGVPTTVPFTGVEGETAVVNSAKAAIKAAGYKQALDADGKPIPALKEMVFHPEVADSISRVAQVFSDPKETGKFFKQYDAALMTWKGLVTRYNPSFHTRTLLGEVMLGYLGGMKSMRASYTTAAKVLRGRNEELLGAAAGKNVDGLSGRQIDAANTLANIPGSAAQAAVRGNSKVVMRHPKFGDLKADFLWHSYKNSGLKSGFASADLARDTSAVSSKTLAAVNDKVQAGTEFVEDYGRMAHFLDVIRHSKAKTLDEAIKEAAEVTMKYHLDYTAVTGFEKTVMTRVMPFYKWIRLSTPLMMEHMVSNPGKVLVVPKTMQMLSNLAGYEADFGGFPQGPDAVVPEWLQDAGAMPVFNMNGNTNYLDPTALFPLAGSAELVDGKPLAGMLTPAFNIPADLLRDKTSIGGQPSDSYKDYALRQLPQTNFANNMVTPSDPGISRGQRVAQFLANPGVQPNTEKRMRGAAYAESQKAQDHRRKVKRDLGITETK